MQLQSLLATTTEAHMAESLCSTTTEAPAVRNPYATVRGALLSTAREKPAPHQRPSTAKNINKLIKIFFKNYLNVCRLHTPVLTRI